MDHPQPGPFIPPPEVPAPRQRNVLLWLALGLVGLILLMICGIGGVLAYFILGESPSLRAPLQAQVEPDLPAPPESPRPPEVAPGGTVFIVEDFDQPTTRWDQSLSRVVDGTYEMQVGTPNFDAYGLFLNANGPIQNFDMAVDVQQVAGAPTSEYGIRFRQSGPGDFLLFSISGSGYYRLVRVSDQEYRSLVPWTFDSRIKTGPAVTNRLRVVAEGDTVTAFINGEEVIKTTDAVQASGQLTLGLTTFDQGDLVVRFDNIAGRAEGLDLQEDFSNPENVGWSIGGATIENGEYEVFAGGGLQAWQQPLPPGSSRVEDFILEVDATLAPGPTDGVGYGVMFGDGGSFDFFSLFILPDGQMTLQVSDGTGNRLELIPPTAIPAIKTGAGVTNHIRVEVQGNIIRVTLNEETLPDIESPFPIEGEVGMIVTSGDSSRVQVRFDNFSLQSVTGNRQQV